MIASILKKDLKRKKTMNIIILLFVILASMFVASSVNNIVTVANGSGYYFEKAGIGDYVVLTMGENVVGRLKDTLEQEPAVQDYRVEEVVFAGQEKFTASGKKVTLHNTALIQSLEDSSQKFFNEKNEAVEKVANGHVYVTSNFLEANELAVGDTVRIQFGEEDKTFTIDGRLKDALLGSTFMGNSRFLISREDYEEFATDPLLRDTNRGEAYYIDTDDTKAIQAALSKVEGIAFDGAQSMIWMCYIMDMIIAGLLIVVSICLIIVAFVVLKFTITFTLTEEFREIGVMKAIGIKDAKIRTIYLTKYLAISIVGACIGLVASIPFGDLLIASVEKNMVLGNDIGIVLNIISAVAVVLIIVGYAYKCTAKLKKYTPLDAIRSGQSGERFQKKTAYRIGKSKLKPTTYMAFNDVLSAPKRYLTVILAFCICSLLVFMMVNTAQTMKSDKLVYTFGKPCDAYYTNVDKAMDGMSGDGKEGINNTLEGLEEDLSKEGIKTHASVEVQFKSKVSFDGSDYKIACQQGVGTKTTDYVYDEGVAPQNKNEIAITKQIADMTGAKIGDTIEMTLCENTEEYLITAYFQTMNQLGEIIRIHEDVPTDMKYSSSVFSFQFDFLDAPTQEVIDQRVEKMKEIFDTDEVYNAADYCADSIGVVDTMETVSHLLLVLTLIVVVLVTVLMERSFISDEKGEIAILKAVGFSDGSVMGWHMKRFALVSLFSVLLAVVLSIPMTNLCITPIFGMMGMKHVTYEINVLQVFVIYPAIIVIVNLIAVAITALYTKKINCRDTASIE